MVSTVSDYDVSVWRDGQALGSIERTRKSVHKGQKRATGVKDLDPGIPPVGHQDIVLLVHCQPRGGVELAVALAVGAEAEQKFTV